MIRSIFQLIHTGALLAPRSTKSCAMVRCPRSQAANKGVVRPKPILGEKSGEISRLPSGNLT